jgi:hypothetical protein
MPDYEIGTASNIDILSGGYAGIEEKEFILTFMEIAAGGFIDIYNGEVSYDKIIGVNIVIYSPTVTTTKTALCSFSIDSLGNYSIYDLPGFPPSISASFAGDIVKTTFIYKK